MTTNIRATCACHSFTLKVDFPSDSLPINRALCLCTGCRKLSGGCGLSYIMIPHSVPVNIEHLNLTSYRSSEKLIRHFCSTCGAHVLVEVIATGRWHLATGIWDRTEGIINWTGCKYVEDTLDGGISVWLSELKDADGSTRLLHRWPKSDGPQCELLPESAFTVLSKNQAQAATDTKLKAECHCGGVRFYITRPNESSKVIRVPFPDLMVAEYKHASGNSQNETWWLREESKYLAGTCTCKSCRLSSGFEIQPWAFIPEGNIVQEDGSPLDYHMGTMKTYPSSDGVSRDFCGVCGATVFWRSLHRPSLVDVSVGLLDPFLGARVESWLDWWTGRVSYEEMSLSRSLVESLEAGLHKWGLAQEYREFGDSLRE